MFCHKCGTEVLSGAKFCQKCGERLITDNAVEQVSATNLTHTTQQSNVSVDTPKEKKRKKWPFILGGAVIVLLVVIFIIGNSGEDVDYVATVKAHKPFAVSQNLPYTFNEVFGKYIDNPIWYTDSIDEKINTGIVKVDGIVKGTEYRIIVSIEVSQDPDNPDGCLIRPQSVNFDGTESSSQGDAGDFLYIMFTAYDEGYGDLSGLLSDLEMYGQQENIELTEIYTNTDAGISFRYPSGWKIGEGGASIVEMFDAENNTADHRASMSVTDIGYDVFGVFTEDTDSIKEAVNDNTFSSNEFLSIEDVKLDGVSAKLLKYRTAGLKGTDIVWNYYYAIDDSIYTVRCSYTENTSGTYEKQFHAILDSYQITAAEAAGSTSAVSASVTFPLAVSSDAIKVFDEWAASHPLVGNYHLDLISDDGVDNAGNKTFLFTLETENVGIFNMSVRKSDGYMEYIEKFGSMSLDEWYDNIAVASGTELDEPIENYWKLSGSYEGSTDMSTLSISIYSSQEEGETAIGNVFIYTNDGKDYTGTIIPIEENVYKVAVDTGEDVLLIESVSGDAIVLQLYVDGVYLDEYHMKEHYES